MRSTTTLVAESFCGRSATSIFQTIDMKDNLMINPNNRANKPIPLPCIGENAQPVFPCHADKSPASPNGFKDATKKPEELKRLFDKYPAPLLGVPTGAVSGFDVLDIDPRHGGDALLAENAHRLPITRTHDTRSGGKHLLFKHHEGLRNSASKIAAGVDVRADGGYVIWWPSTGLAVENETELAEWPEWLLERLKPKPVQRIDFAMPHNLEISDKYARAALRNAAEAVASAPEGTRNDTLNREAWSLMRFVAMRQLQVSDIVINLANAAMGSGLPKPEVLATLSSVIRSRGMIL